MKKKTRRTRQLREDTVEKKRKKINREFAIVTYFVIILFLVMSAYIIFFVVNDSDKVLNNTYNHRQDLLAKKVIKGKIISSDNKVLAKTVTNDKGKESRQYPYNGLFAHVVGQVSQGKTGLEASESYTMLTTGLNPVYSMANRIRGIKDPGRNIVTTLSVDLSKAASDAFGDKKGAAVAIDPKTGKVLCMISKPTYNPNNISDERWRRLLRDKRGNSSLVNRATQGLYPPGSTFKLYTALEYMRENKDPFDFSYKCSGSFGEGKDKVRCYNGEVHGKVSLDSAFAESCNAAFCSIGSKLNRAKWKKTCESLYFNKKIPLDKIDIKPSQLTLSKDTSDGDISQVSMGQGSTLVTPMQNALLVCAALNDGKIMKPYLVDAIQNSAGEVISTNSPSVMSKPISKGEAKKLKRIMRATVTEGTASRLHYSGAYKAGGKTGSAEFSNGSKDSHAWFVGYAEHEGRQIVVSVVVEAAGTGSQYAVPVAQKIFDAYW